MKNGAAGVLGLASDRSYAAEATALDMVRGAATSTPVIAAVVSVWRTFFNIVPFAGERDEASPRMWAGACCQAGLILRDVPSCFGTTAGA
jgi:hypothetical protein